MIREKRQTETEAARVNRRDKNTTDRAHNNCKDLMLLDRLEGLQ